ncbi:hypothetical protein PGT21_016763 [Puccinia graminis f. sp. tritici]|uniref:Uncharacterized protein n=1 Tax=Puccinia graminis f. sp. tritici TaxID=56615 RepID=A0A5B0RJ00_PUCGR|nr:hypothetical protein PGT21_016763 [Puccinia graminis f. sp. tritici]KAA1125961.1 hypothetical protein PGTUg99_025454 [Puccinia graminis f. sp. tritici]
MDFVCRVLPLDSIAFTGPASSLESFATSCPLCRTIYPLRRPGLRAAAATPVCRVYTRSNIGWHLREFIPPSGPQSRDATPMSRSQSVSVVIPTTLPPEFSNPVIRSPEPHTPTTTATTLTKPQATASPTASSTPRLRKMVNPIKRQYRKHNVAYWSKFKTWLK